MNRETFINELMAGLTQLGPVEQRQVADYYNELIFDGVENGKPEEEIIAGFGAPEEIAELAKIVAFYRNESDTAAAFAAQAEKLRARFGGSFEALALDRVIEVSSTALRAGMASGTSEAMSRRSTAISCASIYTEQILISSV